MANNNNGKNKIEVSLGKETNERLESYAEDKGQSVQAIVRESIESHLDKCDVKALITDACKSGNLREGSRACKYTEEEHH
jgi:predicted DNA-binding protein